MDDVPTSCYCSMVASSSSDVTNQRNTKPTAIPKVVLEEQSAGFPADMIGFVWQCSAAPHVNDDFIEAPVFFYDMDYDLKDLNTALKGAEFLQDSGYQSVLERSAHPFSSSIVDDISQLRVAIRQLTVLYSCDANEVVMIAQAISQYVYIHCGVRNAEKFE
ncbi:hypothetical protein OSTOST_02775 [Ostertagia ostertagi]